MRAILAATVPTAIVALHSVVYQQWIVDDAGLPFAYARSLSLGQGPVVQPGAAPVEGFSDPAWIAVLVVGRWTRLFDHGTWLGIPDMVAFPKFVSLACCFGIFLAMHAVAAKVTRHPVTVTIAAGTATAFVPSFVIWTMSGLENGLFACVVMALGALLACAAVSDSLTHTRIAVAAGALAALAALTRPDGVMYAAAFPLAALSTAGRDSLRRAATACVTSLVTFAFPVGIYLVWRLAIFGDYLPNTARAKAQGLPGPEALARPEMLVAYGGWLTALLCAAAVAVALIRDEPIARAIRMLLVPLSLAVVSYAVLQPDWMSQWRFATPIWPVSALVVALSVVAVLPHLSARNRWMAATTATLAAALTLHGFVAAAIDFRKHPSAPLCDIAQNTGYLFNGYADALRVRDGSLLTVDGGGTSLTSRLRFVDLSGLTERRIAAYWQHDDMAGLRDYIFNEVKPTFIKIFSGWAERDHFGLTGDPRLERDYALLLTGGPNSGRWVRRDSALDPVNLNQARLWGEHAWNRIILRHSEVAPVSWTCGDLLRRETSGFTVGESTGRQNN